MWKTMISSDVGELIAFTDGEFLKALSWSPHEMARFDRDAEFVPPNALPIFFQLNTELHEYFSGTRRHFDVPIAPTGTEFQRAAWQALTQIPYGETRSYAEQAIAIGRPKAVRAVGAANGKNPLLIVVPCHRVIGKDGSLTGFGGGIEMKRQLLELESRRG